MPVTTAPAGGHVDGEVALVRLRGRLDATTVAEARALLHGCVDGAPHEIVVDLAEVEMLDAAGLAMIVATHELCQQRGHRLVLVEVPPRLCRLLSATRLTRVLSVRPQAAA